jgi:hypothetical protein
LYPAPDCIVYRPGHHQLQRQYLTPFAKPGVKRSLDAFSCMSGSTNQLSTPLITRNGQTLSTLFVRGDKPCRIRRRRPRGGIEGRRSVSGHSNMSPWGFTHGGSWLEATPYVAWPGYSLFQPGTHGVVLAVLRSHIGRK